MSTQDFFWLVGLLEGEGSFLAGSPSAPNQPKIQINMTDLDVIDRVALLFKVGYIHTRKRPDGSTWKEAYAVSLRGRPAVDLMRRLQPHMSSRRKAQIQKALDSYDPEYNAERVNAPKLTPEKLQALQDELAQFAGRLPHGKLTELAEKYGIARRNVHAIRDKMMRKDWNATTPDERTVLLSPAECRIIEAYRDDRSIIVHADDERAVVIGR